MEEKKLKILAVQMSSTLGDKEKNFNKAEKLIRENYKEGTDVIVLPEVWTVGWKPSLFEKSAENIKNSETINFLSNLATTYNVNIIGGSLIIRKQETEKQTIFNACPVINNKGELIAIYDKMHLFSYYGCDEGKFVREGVNPRLIEINGVKIGLSLCYDIRFPELYRAYRKAGADLLINMAAWPMSRAVHWEALSKARAIENQCFMLALTQSGLIENNEWNLGQSRIIDYNGEVVSEIIQGEGAISAELKFNEMYQFREKCTVLLDIHKNYEVI